HLQSRGTRAGTLLRLDRRHGRRPVDHGGADAALQERHQAAPHRWHTDDTRRHSICAARAGTERWCRRDLAGSGLGAADGVVLRGRRRVVACRDRPGSRRGIRGTASHVPRDARLEAAMFRVILYTQWKWSRLIVVLGSVAGFALPIISLQGAARPDASPLTPGDLLHTVQSWGVLYPVLAATLGLLVALATWAPDHRGRHVHALVLPLPRWRYVLLRFG